jgi:hypothetical protein
MNLYNEGQSTAFVPEVIISYSIPANTAGGSFLLESAIFWGDVSAEFLIYRDDVVVGGARTSTSAQTVQVNYESPIPFNPGEELIVTAEHSTLGLRNFRANLIGRIV